MLGVDAAGELGILPQPFGLVTKGPDLLSSLPPISTHPKACAECKVTTRQGEGTLSREDINLY